MASSFVFRCPGCKARIKAPTRLIGEVRLCPGCAQLFVVPTPVPNDAGPVVLLDDAPSGSGRGVARPHVSRTSVARRARRTPAGRPGSS
jgi:hypothetical protein